MNCLSLFLGWVDMGVYSGVGFGLTVDIIGIGVGSKVCMSICV